MQSSTPISKHSQQRHKLLFGVLVSLVKTSALHKRLTAAQKASLAKEVVYSLRLSNWLLRFDRRSLSWKTPQCLLIEDSTKSYPALPKSGICVNGTVYKQNTLATPTKESDYTSLPTPIKLDHCRYIDHSKLLAYLNRGHQITLSDVCAAAGINNLETLQLFQKMMSFPVTQSN